MLEYVENMDVSESPSRNMSNIYSGYVQGKVNYRQVSVCRIFLVFMAKDC